MKEVEAMATTEFKANLILLLDLLEHGETERAIALIKKILDS